MTAYLLVPPPLLRRGTLTLNFDPSPKKGQKGPFQPRRQTDRVLERPDLLATDRDSWTRNPEVGGSNLPPPPFSSGLVFSVCSGLPGISVFWGLVLSGGVEVDPVEFMARRWFDLVATILVAATVYSVNLFW